MNAAVHKHAEEVVEEKVSEPAPETTTTTPLATTTKEPRRKSTFDLDSGVLTVEEADQPTFTFDTNTLPEKMGAYVKLLGVWTFLRTAESLTAGVAKLMASDIPEVKAKAKEISPWKLAVAHALVEEQKEKGLVMSLDDAKEYADRLDRHGIETAKRNPVVVHFHNQLFPKDAEAGSSLLALTTKAAPAA